MHVFTCCAHVLIRPLGYSVAAYFRIILTGNSSKSYCMFKDYWDCFCMQHIDADWTSSATGICVIEQRIINQVGPVYLFFYN